MNFLPNTKLTPVAAQFKSSTFLRGSKTGVFCSNPDYEIDIFPCISLMFPSYPPIKNPMPCHYTELRIGLKQSGPRFRSVSSINLKFEEHNFFTVSRFSRKLTLLIHIDIV